MQNFPAQQKNRLDPPNQLVLVIQEFLIKNPNTF